jgi:hypothetical protein
MPAGCRRDATFGEHDVPPRGVWQQKALLTRSVPSVDQDLKAQVVGGLGGREIGGLEGFGLGGLGGIGWRFS